MAHDGGVQGQQAREDKSVHIFVGLLLGALVLIGGTALLWVAEEVVGVRDAVLGPLSTVVLIGAVLVVVAYVYRHRRS